MPWRGPRRPRRFCVWGHVPRQQFDYQGDIGRPYRSWWPASRGRDLARCVIHRLVPILQGNVWVVTCMVTGMMLKRRFVLAAIVLMWPTPSPGAQHGSSEVVHVRPITPQLARLMDAGYRLSTTFRDLVDGLQGSSVIVHLVPGEALPPELYGALQFVTTVSGYRPLPARLHPHRSRVGPAHRGAGPRTAACVRDRPGAVGGQPQDHARPLSTDRCQILSGLGSRVLRHDAGPQNRQRGVRRGAQQLERPVLDSLNNVYRDKCVTS